MNNAMPSRQPCLSKSAMSPVRRLDRWARAAIRGCDWFVSSQVIQKPPNWDANHGRFRYNVHIPSGFSTWGLGWTQARAVMCLLPAHERTGDDRYRESARLGLGYAAMLQDLDRRHPRTFGVFREETPHSSFAYPRDATEVADAFLQWYAYTGDRDARERAELFLSWFRRHALVRLPRFGLWVRGVVRFDRPASTESPLACEMGCITILAHAYRVTGKRVYKDLALTLADTTLRNYLRDSSGPFRSRPSAIMAHHVSSDGIIYNDDGGGVGLLNAYCLSRQVRYRDAALRMADYFGMRSDRIPLYSGIGAVANFLLETDRVVGSHAHRRAAERLGKQLLALQVQSGSPLVCGAFRGEDEDPKGYVPGSLRDAFATTRVTAYAVLTLFKLEGAVWPRGYSTVF